MLYALNLTLSLDPEAYLPDDTLEWCSNKIVELGFDASTFNSEQVVAGGVFSHSLAYTTLRRAVREHINAFNADPAHSGPELKELEKPLARLRRQPPPVVQEALANTHNPDFECELPQDGPDDEVDEVEE